MARRFGRRRKPRVVWLPPVGTQVNSALQPGQQYSGGYTTGQLLLGANHNPTISFPLVTDSPDPTMGGGTLIAWQGQSLTEAQELGYRLRRIVGKVHVGLQAIQGQVPTRSGFCSITAGFIIRRVADNGNALATADEVSTQAIQNLTDPWIWRRNWLISTGFIDPGGGDPPQNIFALMPRNNVLGFGAGAVDAAHVDQKTARVVGPEERLFLDVSFTTGLQLEGQDEAEETVGVAIHYDLRVLATLRQNAGNRRNASR